MPGGCWETKQQVKKGLSPVAWPKDFDNYGTYLYGYASPHDGNYMVHRSLRGKEPQWGMGHEAFVGQPSRRVALGAVAAAARSSATSLRGRGRGMPGGRGTGSREVRRSLRAERLLASAAS